MTATVHLCECGCGRPTPLYVRTVPCRGQVAGQPARFLRGHAGAAGVAGRNRRRMAAVRRAYAVRVARAVAATTSLERYAEQLRFASERIIGAVHDDGPAAAQEAIVRALILPAPPGVDPAVALCAVLAAQVDPDSTPEERLGWTRGLEGGAA